MKHTVNTSWKGDMLFDSLLSEHHHLIMDAGSDFGGQDAGPRPKELMLASLAGCTGMDVVSLLKKMRVDIDKFDISIDAELTEEAPKHYIAMHLIYKFWGKGLDKEKIQKAVDLSQERYCGVSAAYKKAMQITFEIQTFED